MLLPLKKQQKELEEKEAELARRRAQMFPQSKEDFKIKPNEVKMRAARFLVADRVRQEKFLAEYQWAWRQVKPLQEIFLQDVSNACELRSMWRNFFFFLQDQFRAEIQSMIISADIQVRDPRKRSSL